MKAYMVHTVLIILLASTGALNICMAQTSSSATSRVSHLVYVSHGKAWGQELTFQVKFSEPLAVLNFVNNLSSNAPNNQFKQLFNSSKFNQPKYQSVIAEFDKLNIDVTYEFPEYPRGEQIGGSTLSLLMRIPVIVGGDSGIIVGRHSG